MNIRFLLFAPLLLAACNSGTTTNTGQSSTAATDTHAVAMNNMQQSQSTPPAGRAASDAMLDEMRRMMADMKAMSMSRDPDHDFAMMMKRHHEGAIEIAIKEVNSGADAELKQIAQKMKDDQQAENVALQTFLSSHKPAIKTSFAENAMKQMEASPMMNLPMKGDPDQDFAALMTEHHKGAMDMATEYLKTGKVDKIKEMARKMITMQKEEIGKLSDWTARHASKG